MTRATATGRNGTYYYYRCSKKHRTANEACKTRDIPADALENFVLNQLRNYAVDPIAIQNAVAEANEGRDTQLQKVEEEIAKVKSAVIPIQTAMNAIADSVESGGDVALLVERRRQKQSRESELKAELIALETKRQALRQQVLDSQVVAEGHQRLSYMIEEAQKQGALAELRGLLQMVINVVEWRESPDDQRKGQALIQQFEVPEPFWKQRKGAENEQSSAPVSSGSLGCPKWLRKRNENANQWVGGGVARNVS